MQEQICCDQLNEIKPEGGVSLLDCIQDGIIQRDRVILVYTGKMAKAVDGSIDNLRQSCQEKKRANQHASGELSGI